MRKWDGKRVMFSYRENLASSSSSSSSSFKDNVYIFLECLKQNLFCSIFHLIFHTHPKLCRISILNHSHCLHHHQFFESDKNTHSTLSSTDFQELKISQLLISVATRLDSTLFMANTKILFILSTLLCTVNFVCSRSYFVLVEFVSLIRTSYKFLNIFFLPFFFWCLKKLGWDSKGKSSSKFYFFVWEKRWMKRKTIKALRVSLRRVVWHYENHFRDWEQMRDGWNRVENTAV